MNNFDDHNPAEPQRDEPEGLPPELRPSGSNMVAMALAFELTLAVAALGLGRWFGFWPAPGFRDGSTGREMLIAVSLGMLASLPLMLAMLASVRWPIGPLKDLLKLVERDVLPLFAGVNQAGLLAISLAAGVGEELLFRGLLQGGLAIWIGGAAGPWVALVASSVAFGFCHSLSRAYAVAAIFAGLYFGLLFLLTGSILTPLVAHALYDFAALMVLTRRGRSTDE